MNSLKTYLVEVLCNTKIFEMAYARAKYQDHVDSLATQLVENWCLIRYCSTVDKNNINKEHWKQELYAHISNLQKQNIKVDKTRATEEVLIRWIGFNNYNMVIRYISDKWYKEKLDIDAKYSEEIANDFSEYGVYDLIKIISKNSLTRTDIVDYINTI